ncbi:LLM class flavin-dependent oxidoreductase [Calothrix sp. PCC 7507]|uniref:LLM class flavin-dependent oxidoreductase n=1 Tax=Calothrix sp. PCC 7507 TaxID=99598 RepID=UPI00029F2796|nr:LLM class flavin-dependent oxidoreductase [Calothrix sp. PCC 7507]AFY31157.1 dibenzothiophene-5,5-dioxide monooxygenase [Calothrix sp. PCC 7507]
MKQIHLAGFLLASQVVHSHAVWRHPRTELGFLEPEYYQKIAQVLERGKFDLVFFADSLTMPDTYGGNFAESLKYGAQGALRLDPLVLATTMAVATKHIGLGITRSTTYYQPYDLARGFATLDHLSRGRAAWNVVTSSRASEAGNFGFDEHLEHDLRYDRADEFLEVATKLWGSWEEGALVLDQENGIFADPTKVNYVNYVGQWLKSRGPLTVPRSPQGRPVIIQAGASNKGREFAAKWAELIFEISPNPALMKSYYQDVKTRMAKYGRDPDTCKILPAVMPFVGETETIAKEKQAFHNELVHPMAGLLTMSNHLAVDLSPYSLEQSVEKVEVQDFQKLSGVLQRLNLEASVTLKDLGKIYGRSLSVPQLVGTATQIADKLETLFRDEVGDGFVISPAYLPGAFEEFVDLVIPELQKRGLFRKEYPGKTLRDSLGLN